MKLFPFLLILSLLAGCAHQGVSKDTLRLADRSVTYPALKENPEQFTGRFVHLGGTIAGVRNTASGGIIEVVQVPLDRSGKPGERSHSEGRFLAQGNTFLDPLIYKPGTLMTVVGEVKGKKVGLLDNVEYHYPVILIKESYLWKPEDFVSARPRFHFGLGFFQGF